METYYRLQILSYSSVDILQVSKLRFSSFFFPFSIYAAKTYECSELYIDCNKLM